MYKGTYIHL